MRMASRSRSKIVVVAGVVLTVAILSALAIDAVADASTWSGNNAESSVSELGFSVTPCFRLSTAVLSDEPIDEVVRSFGLTSDVRVPAGTETGKRHCISRQAVGTLGDVLGIAIEDRGGTNVWVILSEQGLKLDDITEQDWRQSLANEGFSDLRRVHYGFTTEPTPNAASDSTANLWFLLANDVRGSDDG
jgi:hypothetical protein